jgi:glycosyltransferase involved in cell wall biosynthesis
MKNVFLIGSETVRLNRADPFVYMNYCNSHALLGIKTTLIVPASKLKNCFKPKNEIWNLYGLKPNFKIIELPIFMIGKKLIQMQNYLISSFYFIYLYMKRELRGESIIFSFCRSKTVALIHLKKIGIIKSKIIFIQSTYKDNYLTKYIAENSDGINPASKWVYDRILNYKKVTKNKVFYTDHPSVYYEEMMKHSLKDKSEFLKKMNIPIDKKIICYAGKVGPNHKELNYFLESSKYIRSEDAIILVIGARKETGAFDFYKNYLKKKKLNNVIIKKHLPVKTLMQLLRCCDILVSYYSAANKLAKQMKPAKLSMYLCAEKPIIFGDIPALREFLDEDSVYFVEPDKPAKLGEKISYILEHKNESKIKAKNCLKLAQKFSVENITINKLKFVDRL